MRTSIASLSLALAVALPLRAQQGSPAACPTGNEDIRTVALSALVQVDNDQVLPTLKKVLERRDVCSIPLRRQALSFLTRKSFGDQTDTFLDVARKDASDEVRRYAIQQIARTSSDRSIAILDSIINKSEELESRDVALRALAQESAPAARESVRRVAENATVPLDLRMRAVSALGNGRHSADDGAYFIALYGKAQQPELREAIMRAIVNQHSAESTNFLLGIARDKGRDLETRRQALYVVGQAIRNNDSGTSAGIDLPKLLSLYDDFSGQLEMQDRAIDMISQRQESAATDKLLDIAKNEKNIELRRKALLRVGQRRDPRVREFLLQVLAQQ